MSTNHDCPVLDFDFSKIQKHPNADRLGVYQIGMYEYFYCLSLADWSECTDLKKVVWIPPQSLVPVGNPEFSFLATEAKYDVNSNTSRGGSYARIKAKKLRGVNSFGLLIPYFGPLEEGENAANELGVVHYEAPINVDKNGKALFVGGDSASAPSGDAPTYDLEAFRKYGRILFQEGDSVNITVKIHGENSRVVFKDGSLHVGSRNGWKKELATAPAITIEDLVAKGVDPVKAAEIFETKVTNHKAVRSYWWTALEEIPGVEKFCRENHGCVIYGENYGHNPGYRYDCKPGSRRFRAFDIRKADGSWMLATHFFEACKEYDIPTAPVISYDMAFSFDEVVRLSNEALEPNFHSGGICEGIVVWLNEERYNAKYGRAKLKIVSMAYAEK